MGDPCMHALAASIIRANPDKAKEARDKPELVRWFAGKVLKGLRDPADPETVMEVVCMELRL